MKKYGLTLTQYRFLLRSQKRKCFICGYVSKVDLKNPKHCMDLQVDHCHDTGKVRGLLCVRCNMGLGYFKDNTERLKKAVEYLERPAPELISLDKKLRSQKDSNIRTVRTVKVIKRGK